MEVRGWGESECSKADKAVLRNGRPILREDATDYKKYGNFF